LPKTCSSQGNMLARWCLAPLLIATCRCDTTCRSGHADRCPGCRPLRPLTQPTRWWETVQNGMPELPARSQQHHHTISPAQLRQPIKSGNYSVLLVTYAQGEPFVSTQRKLIKTAKAAGGVDTVVSWDFRSLNSTAWARRHLSPLALRRWAWKPFLILDALRRVRTGDFVVYLDSSRYIRRGFTHSILPLTNFLHAEAEITAGAPRGSTYGAIAGLRHALRNNAGIFWNGRNVHEDHHTKTKRCDLCDLVWHLGLCHDGDETCCDRYYHAPHVQASYSVWQKGRFSLSFVHAWKAACEDEEVLKRCKWGDQSVLTLLATKASFELGLRLAHIAFPSANGSFTPVGNRRKDPSELLGRMASVAGGDLPHFLLASDPYPECEALPEERRRELRDAARNVTAAKLLPWFRRGRGDVSKYTHSIAIMCD